MFFFPTKGLAVAAAGLAVLVGMPAFAAGDQQTAVAVRHVVAPANANEADRLLRRLDEAAMEACGASTHSLSQYRDTIRRSACWRTSMTDVVQRIADAKLTDAFHQREKMQLVSTDASAIAGN
jgi:UrcA family protein